MFIHKQHDCLCTEFWQIHQNLLGINVVSKLQERKTNKNQSSKFNDTSPY